MSFSAATNAIITSSRAHRSPGPLRIQFGSDWQDNGIMDWHGPRPTKINTFQLRRERSNPLKHQYIVLILSSDCILRLDRRGDEDNPMDAVRTNGTESIDTITNVKSLADLDKTSYCLAELHCQGSDVDLSNIIKICFGIHRDDKAQRYTLQCFNCYFFSWTILVATARHAVRWETVPFRSPWETLSRTLADALSMKAADALIDMIVDGGVIIMMAIHLRLKPQLLRAVSWRARLAWMMPRPLIRFILRGMIQTLWRSKMRTLLRLKLRTPLLEALQPTFHRALTNLRTSTLRTTLWKEDVGNAMRDTARRDVMGSLLDAGTNALSSVRFTEEDVDVFRSLAVTFLHRDFLDGGMGDWCGAITAGFNAIMQATPLFAAHGADGFITDDAKWDELWNSIRDTIREETKGAMKDVQEGRWETLWDALMEEWAAGWDIIRPKMRDTARGTLKEMTDLVNDAFAYSVVNTLQDTPLNIGVRNMVPSRVSNSKFIARLADLTDSEVQPYVLKLIRDHSDVVGRVQPGSSAEVEKSMRGAMGRVWKVAVDLDGGGVDANDIRNADAS